MRIRELAGITTPEPRVIMIQPWDAGLSKAIAKASHVGLLRYAS